MQVQQAVKYFKGEKGFQRLLTLFVQKYQSLGHIGGSVKLNNLSEAEKEALSMLMRRDYSKQKSVTISLTSFEAALQKTKFADVTLKELLDGFVGQNILSNSEKKYLYQKQKDIFFNTLMQKYPQEKCRQWLMHIKNKGFNTKGVHRAYDLNAGLLRLHLSNVLTALQQLPELEKNRYERLPFFAGRVTGDPHGFDLNTEQGRLLLNALQFLQKQRDADYPVSTAMTAEEKSELLACFGILRDDLLNFVTCTGILAFRTGCSKPAATWLSAYQESVVVNMPLREIIKMDRFIPAAAFCNARQERQAFIIENSGVYSELLDRFSGRPVPPLICTHGQLKLANLVLLDKLVKSGTTVFYSGDFDPEGLQMAQRVLKRYGKHARAWRYGVNDYLACISQVELPSVRLKKLSSVTAIEFAEVKREILKQKKAGYQEYLIHKLLSDIDSYMR